MKKTFKINEDIAAEQVKLIDDEGKLLGVKSLQDALKIASEKNLDLVAIDEKGPITLCKLCKASALAAKNRKKQKEIKKNTKTNVVKEIRIRPNIGKHDLDIKVQQAKKMLEKKYQVNFVMRFMGRERLYIENYKSLLRELVTMLSDHAFVESDAFKLEGNQIFTKFIPNKKQ